MSALTSPLAHINRLRSRKERDVYAALYMLLMSGAVRPSHVEVRYSKPITHEALGRQHSVRPGRLFGEIPSDRSGANSTASLDRRIGVTGPLLLRKRSA